MENHNNLFHLLWSAAIKTPQAPLFLSESVAFSYEEVYKLALSLSLELKERSLTKRIAVLDMRGSAKMAILVFAMLAAGCTVCPLSPNCSEYELKMILDICGEVNVFFDDAGNKNHSAIYDERQLSIFPIEELIADTKNHCVIPTEPCVNHNNDIAFLLGTSGSTGSIKLVSCTHKAIYFAITKINKVLQNCQEDIILDILPFSFDYGLYQIFIATQKGSSVFFIERDFHLLEISSIIRKHKITALPVTPQVLILLQNSGKVSAQMLEQLKYITSTGDVLPVEIVDQYLAISPQTQIFCMYGLTECKRVSMLRPDEYFTHKGSVGRPLEGVTVRIVDNNLTSVPPGVPGELLVSGPNIMKGYYGDEDLTRKRFRTRSDHTQELLTGDIFYQDEEGYLYFVGRTQLFIKISDQRVSPKMIENYFYAIDGIDDCAILPFRKNGYDEIACVISSKYPITDIQSEINKKIPSRYLPHHIMIIDNPFPMNRNGKRNNDYLIKLLDGII